MKTLCCLLLAGAAAFAQEPAPPRPPSVRAAGEGIVNTAPDRAEIEIGVITQAATAEAAATQNARQAGQVMAALQGALGETGEIRTLHYSLQPEYRFPEGGGRKPAGYTANNTLLVRTDDLTRVGKLIDGAMQAGANNINRLQYSLKDEQAVRNQALQQAARKAHASAEAMAAALGLKVVGVLHAEEESGGIVYPMRDMAMRTEMAKAAPTPVEPGNIEVRARVVLLLEVAR